MKDVQAVNEVCEELTRALDRYPSFNSPHEGYSVILEEVDELWDLVKAWKATKPNTQLDPYQDRCKTAFRAEAKQIAAMAIRFMVDLT